MPVIIKKADGSEYKPPATPAPAPAPGLHTVAVVSPPAPPTAPPPPPSPLIEALKKAAKAPLPTDSLPPWESPPDYGFAQALKDMVANKYPGRVLKIIAKNGGASYTVMSYNPTDKRAVVISPEGFTLNPVLGEREEGLYMAHWE